MIKSELLGVFFFFFFSVSLSLRPCSVSWRPPHVIFSLPPSPSFTPDPPVDRYLLVPPISSRPRGPRPETLSRSPARREHVSPEVESPQGWFSRSRNTVGTTEERTHTERQEQRKQKPMKGLVLLISLVSVVPTFLLLL